MNRPTDPGRPHVPASAWADTQRIAPHADSADLNSPATQIVGDRDAYLGGQGDVGRRIGEDQVELFITGDVAGALQCEFQTHQSHFIALHDIGSSGSLRLLGSLAGSASVRVQRLSVRRQGHGLALAVLQFVEVPLGDGSRMRVYSTDINADGTARQQVARVLLAHSQLGVLLVGDLPLHAVSTALHPLHEHMSRGLWPNRELLLVPLAGNATLATQGAQLAAGSPVAVHVAPRAAKPRQVWSFIAGAWNARHGAPGGKRDLQTDIAQAVPGTGPGPGPGPGPGADTSPSAAQAVPTQAESAPLAATLRHAKATELPSGFAQRGLPQREPAPQPQPIPMPVPGGTRWQGFAQRCLGIKGVVSVCVFDTHTLQALAHAGGAPSAERLAQQGALLMAEMVDVARALGLGATRPDAAISVGAYHLLLQHVAGHPGVAVHLMLQASGTHLTVARVQLERIEIPS